MPKPQVASSRRPQYVQFFRDRLGRQVCYYRRGTLRIRLRSEPPYTEAWWKEYAAARSGSPLLPDDGGGPPERGRNRPGSWNALIAKYTDSAPYKVLKPRTAAVIPDLYRQHRRHLGRCYRPGYPGRQNQQVDRRQKYYERRRRPRLVDVLLHSMPAGPGRRLAAG
jgi:hypothetical protein